MCMLYMYMSHDTSRGGEIIGSNRFIGRCEVGYRFRSFVIVAAVTGSNRLNRLWSEPVGVLRIASSLGGASRLALRSVQLRCRSTKAAQTGESG
jgi:hypothetical protein